MLLKVFVLIFKLVLIVLLCMGLMFYKIWCFFFNIFCKSLGKCFLIILEFMCMIKFKCFLMLCGFKILYNFNILFMFVLGLIFMLIGL